MSKNLRVRIEATISRAGAGMILWSKEAVDRKWVALEIDKLVARRAVDHLFPLFVVRLDGTNPPQGLTLKASHEFSVNTLAELNNLALLVAADLQLPPDGPKGSAHVQCSHCNAEEAWNTIFCRVCKKHVFPQCPVCGAKAHCRHVDTSGGEIYFAEFQLECHNPRCGHRDSYKSCAGHAGEWWEPQECTYCEAHF